VRWVDTDASGIIHFTAAFRYTEAAETEWFRAAGIDFPGVEASALSLPRVHVAADFRSALRFDDHLAIAVRPGRLGRTSLALAFEIRREEDPTGEPPAITVEIVLVCTDARIQGAAPWPEAVRARLLAAGARPA
jgi:YbgC/YbaW family acyl-CoA thioester hydrolase